AEPFEDAGEDRGRRQGAHRYAVQLRIRIGRPSAATALSPRRRDARLWRARRAVGSRMVTVARRANRLAGAQRRGQVDAAQAAGRRSEAVVRDDACRPGTGDWILRAASGRAVAPRAFADLAFEAHR